MAWRVGPERGAVERVEAAVGFNDDVEEAIEDDCADVDAEAMEASSAGRGTGEPLGGVGRTGSS